MRERGGMDRKKDSRIGGIVKILCIDLAAKFNGWAIFNGDELVAWVGRVREPSRS